MNNRVIKTDSQNTFLKVTLKKLLNSLSFYIGGLIVLVGFIIAAFPQIFTSKNPENCILSNSKMFPSKTHWFGTDIQGCDYFAKVIYGGRISLLIGILATLIILLIGIVFGTIAGYFNKFVDDTISRITDIFFAIPSTLGAMVVLTIISNKNLFTISLALSLFGWMSAMRLIRASVLSVKEKDFVVAARALGVGHKKIIINHIIPNTLSPVIVYATTAVGVFISSEAALTFLGLGLQPPATSWGLQISQAQPYFTVYPYLLLFPAIFLSITVLGYMLLGNAIQKALEVRI